MSDAETPELIEVLEAAMQGVMDGTRTNLVGRIESYDKATRRATIQLLVMDGHIDGNGERQTTVIAPLSDVPMMRVGSGIERFKFPVRAGDRCLVSFSSSSIARLKSIDDVVDPEDDRHHHEADGIAQSGVFLAGDDVPGTLIEIDDNEVLHLGASPAPSSAVLGEQFLSALGTLVGAIATAVATSGTPAGATASGTAISGALTAFQGAVAGYLSQKVKLV